MSIEPMVEALRSYGWNPKQRGHEWISRCPVHGAGGHDSAPSLSVRNAEDGITPLIRCHANCNNDDIIAAVGISWRQILPDREMGDPLAPPRPVMRRFTPGQAPQTMAAAPVVTTGTAGEHVPVIPDDAPPVPERMLTLDGQQTTGRWHYRDQSGQLLMGVLRWDTPGGKQFRPLTLWRHAGRLCWDLLGWPGGARPPYGLERLAQSTGMVMLCEGEKAADAAAELFPGMACLGWHGGVAALPSIDWAPLLAVLAAGREVILWPDADRAGVECMDTLAANYLPGARVVEVFPWLAPDGDDLADDLHGRRGWDWVRSRISESWYPSIVDLEEMLGSGRIFRPWDTRYCGPFRPVSLAM